MQLKKSFWNSTSPVLVQGLTIWSTAKEAWPHSCYESINCMPHIISRGKGGDLPITPVIYPTPGAHFMWQIPTNAPHCMWGHWWVLLKIISHNTKSVIIYIQQKSNSQINFGTSVRNFTRLNVHTGHVEPCITVITANPVLTVFCFFPMCAITYSTIVHITFAWSFGLALLVSAAYIQYVQALVCASP